MKKKITALILAVILLTAATCSVAYAGNDKSQTDPDTVSVDDPGYSTNFLPFILMLPCKY